MPLLNESTHLQDDPSISESNFPHDGHRETRRTFGLKNVECQNETLKPLGDHNRCPAQQFTSHFLQSQRGLQVFAT